MQRLLDLGVIGGLAHWVKDFFTDCPQRVHIKESLSDEVVVNTRPPQAYSITSVHNEIALHNSNFKLFKYADDMALEGLSMDVSDYFVPISKLEQWFKSSSLLINAAKTKELVLSQADPLSSLNLCDQAVDTVNCFKRLGTWLQAELHRQCCFYV